MEFLMELILEIVLEGTLELGSSKKVPMPLRVLALLIFVGVYGGLIVVFALLGIDAMKTRPAVGWLFLILAAALAMVVFCAIRKKWKENR